VRKERAVLLAFDLLVFGKHYVSAIEVDLLVAWLDEVRGQIVLSELLDLLLPVSLQLDPDEIPGHGSESKEVASGEQAFNHFWLKLIINQLNTYS
jgi:hypothetical protein